MTTGWQFMPNLTENVATCETCGQPLGEHRWLRCILNVGMEVQENYAYCSEPCMRMHEPDPLP